MEAYRDQYATLFRSGRGVVVLGVSVDPDTLHAAWMAEKELPFVFGSDADGKVGTLYGAYNPQNKVNRRALYVIGPDGRIAYKTPNFNVMSQDAYSDLGAAVAKVAAPIPAEARP